MTENEKSQRSRLHGKLPAVLSRRPCPVLSGRLFGTLLPETFRGRFATLLAVLIGVGLAPQVGSAPGDRVAELVRSLPLVANDDGIELRSDANLSEPRSVLAHIKDAYDFDVHLQGWDGIAELHRPIIVGLASDKAIEQYVSTTMGGRAVGDSMFASHETIYRDRPDVAWFITAHELEHLLMHRIGAREPAVPVYIFEGIACSLGDRYVRHLGDGGRYFINARGKLASYTDVDADDMFKNFRSPADIADARTSGTLWRNEHLGGLFFEFLLAGSGKTPAQFFRDFGLLTTDVAKGVSFDDAFKKRLGGLSLSEQETAFVSFMRDTKGAAASRFRGTIYE